MTTPQFRSFIFTLYDSPSLTSWKTGSYFEEKDYSSVVQYAIYQLERCPDTGREHIQGYVELHGNKKHRLNAIRRLLDSPSVHVEIRRGTQQQAIEYCSKEETRICGPWTFGTPKQQGQRTDLSKLVDAVKKKRSLHDIAHDHPVEFVKFHRGLTRLQSIWFEKKRTAKTHVTWIYGPSGNGKSYRARELAGDPEDVYWKSASNKWFDDYTHESTIVLDDVKDSTHLGGWSSFLNLLDAYPYRVENKFGSRWFSAERIIITSIHEPERYVPTMEDPYQLTRRIDVRLPLLTAWNATDVSNDNDSEEEKSREGSPF